MLISLQMKTSKSDYHKEAAELSGEPTVIYKDSEKKRVDEKRLP